MKGKKLTVFPKTVTASMINFTALLSRKFFKVIHIPLATEEKRSEKRCIFFLKNKKKNKIKKVTARACATSHLNVTVSFPEKSILCALTV